MADRIIVNLYISSETLSCEEITSRINLTPDNITKIGDPVPSTILVNKFNTWELSSGLDNTFSIKEQLISLFKKIESVENNISHLKDVADISISCIIYYTIQPPFYLDADMVKKCCAIGASVDFDAYHLCDRDCPNGGEVTKDDNGHALPKNDSDTGCSTGLNIKKFHVMTDRIIVRLTISSTTLSCEKITSQINLAPDSIVKIDDHVPFTTLVNKFNTWELSSGLDDIFSIKEQLVSLFKPKFQIKTA